MKQILQVLGYPHETPICCYVPQDPSSWPHHDGVHNPLAATGNGELNSETKKTGNNKGSFGGFIWFL